MQTALPPRLPNNHGHLCCAKPLERFWTRLHRHLISTAPGALPFPRLISTIGFLYESREQRPNSSPRGAQLVQSLGGSFLPFDFSSAFQILWSQRWLLIGPYLHPSCPSLFRAFIPCFLPPLGEDISFLEAGLRAERMERRAALFAMCLAFGWLSKRRGGPLEPCSLDAFEKAQQSGHCVRATGEVTYNMWKFLPA